MVHRFTYNWHLGLQLHMSKKLVSLLDLCVSSLRKGHANRLCIVPILTDDPQRKSVLVIPMLVQIRGQLEEVGKVSRRGCSKKACITSRLVRVILAQGPC